jgi:DNA primase
VQAPRLPRNWRTRLPDPETYYRARVAKLGARHGNGWAQGRCPFHEDRNASLSVRLDGERGHWRCFTGCGHGDLVSFHMRLIDRPFIEAVRDLVGGAYGRRT